MTLFLLGVNHRTAALEDREALALSSVEVLEILERLARRGVLRESLVLSTCNRTEIYAVAAEITAAEHEVRHAVQQLRGRDLLEPGPHRYLRSGPAVATHLLRVACGLDSMVLGDVQILGQVKDAYALARQAGTAGVLLERLLETALHAGKRARAETAIGAGHVSMSSSAVAAAVNTVGLRGRRVLVVGAGETARLAARHAAEHEPAAIVVANRTVEHAEAVARDVRGQAVPLDSLADALKMADVVFSATSAPGTIIAVDIVREAMAARPDRPLLVLDLALPRDVDAAAADVAGVTLRTLDTIRAAVDHTLSTRSAEVPQVEAIVAEESDRFSSWTRSLAAKPTLVALREHFERIRNEELDRVLRHASDEERQRAERLTRVLVNRLLHVPMLRLKETDAASTDGQLRLQAARDLFALGVSFDAGRRHDA
jgi:glutamyl-tRNA reductase